LDNYPRELGLLSDEVPPIPIEIWNWGVKNRTCAFIKRDRDIVRLNILPRATAAITREGIKYKKMFYSCDKAMEEQWFINPSRKPVEFAYDPRNLEYIYLPDERGRTFIKCFLLEKSIMYKGFMYEEVVFQQELEREHFEQHRQNQLQNDVELEHNINKIIKKDQERVKIQPLESKKRKVKNIKENRSLEKESNRRKEYFELEKDKDSPNNAIVTDFPIISTAREKDESSIKNKLELLRKMRDEKLGK
jgi:hypothetical protein